AEIARLQKLDQRYQATIRDSAALRADKGHGHLHHDRSRPASDVGGAVLSFPGAAALDDIGWLGNNGLRLAGRGRGADGASELARHRHRWRSVGADDHAG